MAELLLFFLNRENCSALLNKYKDCLVKLTPKPSYLKDFAAQLQTVNAMKEDEKQLFKATSQVILFSKVILHLKVLSIRLINSIIF